MDASPASPVQCRLSATIERVYRRFDESFLRNPKVGELFESILRGLYECWLEPGDVAIDVGANYGLHTCPMAAAVKPGGTVYAFEPIPVVAAALEQRIAHEGASEVVKLIRVALSNYSGRAEFVSVEADYGYSGLRPKPYPFEPRKRMIEVEVDTLDRCVAAAEKVAFLKLDIEGGEFHALQGGIGLLRARRPLIVFENGKQESAQNYGYTKEDFFAFFRGLDYELHDILGCRMTPETWGYVGPWYTVASPREDSHLAIEALAACSTERLLALPW